MDHLPAIHQVLTEGTGDSTAYRLAPNVLLVKVWDGSSRLIDLGGESFGLSAVSTTLLELTLRKGPEAAVEESATQWATPVEKVRADFEPFLRDLGHRGLLTQPGQRGWWQGGIRKWVAWPVPLALRFVLQVIPTWSGKAQALLALAYVSLKLFSWANTVQLWKQAFPGEFASSASDPAAAVALLDQLDHTIGAALAQSVLPVDCKARALCCWALLRSAGLPARLVVGFDLFPFLGHCWCESGDRILADRTERCNRFTPVLQYV